MSSTLSAQADSGFSRSRKNLGTGGVDDVVVGVSVGDDFDGQRVQGEVQAAVVSWIPLGGKEMVNWPGRRLG